MPNEPITEERLVEIRGREKAATRGPWVFEEPDGKVLLGYTPKVGRVGESGCLGSIASRFVCDMHSDWRYTYKDKDEPLANAAFIAHAREDITALLDEVERLRAENEKLRDEFWEAIKVAKRLITLQYEKDMQNINELSLRYTMEHKKIAKDNGGRK